MNWFPLCNFTHYSLQKGFSKPHELAKKCKDNGYTACGIADYKSISGAVSFYKACVKNDIKPIIGCAFDNFTLFSKNHEGWLELIQIVSSIENGQPSMSLILRLADNGNLISIAKRELDSPIKGKDFYEKSESFMDVYYAERSQAPLHRILLCSNMKTTLSKINRQITNGETVDNQVFFESDEFFLRDKIEITEVILNDHKSEQFKEIFEKCENYNILNKPMLPTFPTPFGESEEEYLKHLCRIGWRNELLKTGKVENEEDEQNI